MTRMSSDMVFLPTNHPARAAPTTAADSPRDPPGHHWNPATDQLPGETREGLVAPSKRAGEGWRGRLGRVCLSGRSMSRRPECRFARLRGGLVGSLRPRLRDDGPEDRNAEEIGRARLVESEPDPVTSGGF